MAPNPSNSDFVSALSSNQSRNATEMTVSEEEEEFLINAESELVFDSCIEKVTCQFEYGDQVSIQLSCVVDDPGNSSHFVWPAAPGMCKFLQQNWAKLPSGNIVELGAGCGLAGLAAAQLDQDAFVIFTDHDPGVLKTIEHNIQLQKKSQAKCTTIGLQWGLKGKTEIDKIVMLQKLYGNNNQKEGTNLIVGTDVIYAVEIVDLLFWTVNALLPKDKDNQGVFAMCSSFHYDTLTESCIEKACILYDLKREILSCDIDNGGVRVQLFSQL